MKNIGKICIHKESKHEGRIMSTLTGTNKFPNQWGIFWFDGRRRSEDAKRNKTIGILPYWCDVDKIIIFSSYQIFLRKLKLLFK